MEFEVVVLFIQMYFDEGMENDTHLHVSWLCAVSICFHQVN